MQLFAGQLGSAQAVHCALRVLPSQGFASSQPASRQRIAGAFGSMPGPPGSVTEAGQWQVSLWPFNILPFYLSSGLELELDAFVLSAAAASCNRGHLWKERGKQR